MWYIRGLFRYSLLYQRASPGVVVLYQRASSGIVVLYQWASSGIVVLYQRVSFPIDFPYPSVSVIQWAVFPQMPAPVTSNPRSSTSPARHRQDIDKTWARHDLSPLFRAIVFQGSMIFIVHWTDFYTASRCNFIVLYCTFILYLQRALWGPPSREDTTGSAFWCVEWDCVRRGVGARSDTRSRVGLYVEWYVF